MLLYRDLLLLGDLASISQEEKTRQWIQQAGSLSVPGADGAMSLSSPHSGHPMPAQTALLSSLIGLVMKMTGQKPNRSCSTVKHPGDKLRGRDGPTVLAFLAIIQQVADAMADANNGYKSVKSTPLRRMHADINKIVSKYK